MVVVAFISFHRTGNALADAGAALLHQNHGRQNIRVYLGQRPHLHQHIIICQMGLFREFPAHEGSGEDTLQTFCILRPAVIGVGHELEDTPVIQEVSRVHVMLDNGSGCSNPVPAVVLYVSTRFCIIGTGIGGLPGRCRRTRYQSHTRLTFRIHGCGPVQTCVGRLEHPVWIVRMHLAEIWLVAFRESLKLHLHLKHCVIHIFIGTVDGDIVGADISNAAVIVNHIPGRAHIVLLCVQNGNLFAHVNQSQSLIQSTRTGPHIQRVDDHGTGLFRSGSFLCPHGAAQKQSQRQEQKQNALTERFCRAGCLRPHHFTGPSLPSL